MPGDRSRGGLLVATLLMAAFCGRHANAQQRTLHVLSGGSLVTPLNQLTSSFESQSGSQLSISFDLGGNIVKRLEGGEKPDLIIAADPSFQELSKKGLVDRTRLTKLVASQLVVMVPANSPHSDISTDRKFEDVLLHAKAISYTNPSGGGSSGVFMSGLIAKLGLTDALRAKTHLVPSPGGNVARLVASHGVELGIGQLSEVISVPGIEYVTPLPSALKPTSTFTMEAYVLPTSTNGEAANAYVAFLRGSRAASVFKENGLSPLGQ